MDKPRDIALCAVGLPRVLEKILVLEAFMFFWLALAALRAD
jgi:hypothetical protein